MQGVIPTEAHKLTKRSEKEIILIKILQKKRTNRRNIYIYTHVYIYLQIDNRERKRGLLKKLVYAVKAKKSHTCSLQGREPGKPVIIPYSKGLRTRGAHSITPS